MLFTSFEASSSKNRVIGENKLLSSKKKATPYSKGCLDCKVSFCPSHSRSLGVRRESGLKDWNGGADDLLDGDWDYIEIGGTESGD